MNEMNNVREKVRRAAHDLNTRSCGSRSSDTWSSSRACRAAVTFLGVMGNIQNLRNQVLENKTIVKIHAFVTYRQLFSGAVQHHLAGSTTTLPLPLHQRSGRRRIRPSFRVFVLRALASSAQAAAFLGARERARAGADCRQPQGTTAHTKPSGWREIAANFVGTSGVASSRSCPQHLIVVDWHGRGVALPWRMLRQVFDRECRGIPCWGIW